MNEPSSRRVRPGRAVAVAFALTVGAFLATIVVGIVFLTPMLVLGYEVDDTPVLVVGTVATQLAFLAVGLLYVRRYGLEITFSAPTLRSFGYVAGGTVVALVAAMGLLSLAGVLDLQPESALEETAAIDPTFFLALAALSLLLIAPAEEFLFRGVVQGRLRESFGPVGAIAGASLLFGSPRPRDLQRRSLALELSRPVTDGPQFVPNGDGTAE